MLYVGIALFGVGVLVAIAGFLHRLKAKKILGAPVVQTGAIAANQPVAGANGLVSCEGAARTQQPIAAPCSNQPCVYYRLKLEKRVKEKRGNQSTVSWKPVSEHSHGTFYVDDGSGGVWVQPEGLEADLTRTFSGPPPAHLAYLVGSPVPSKPGEQILEHRATEDIIPLDTRVFVMGTLAAGQITKPMVSTRGRAAVTEEAIRYAIYYRLWHDDSPEHAAAMLEYYRPAFERHPEVGPSEPILDVGCGMGFALLALRSLGYRNIAGVDIDEEQIASAPAKALDVELTADTAALLAGRAARYAAITCFDVLEHVPVASQLGFLRAIHSALRPGGTLILTVPNANSSIAARWRYGDWTHSSSFTESSLDFVLQNSGFVDVTVGEIELQPKPQGWIPSRAHLRRWLLKGFRLVRRLEMAAELGQVLGRQIPLSVNLLGAARRPHI